MRAVGMAFGKLRGVRLRRALTVMLDMADCVIGENILISAATDSTCPAAKVNSVLATSQPRVTIAARAADAGEAARSELAGRKIVSPEAIASAMVHAGIGRDPVRYEWPAGRRAWASMLRRKQC